VGTWNSCVIEWSTGFKQLPKYTFVLLRGLYFFVCFLIIKVALKQEGYLKFKVEHK
jgi:hypothetical protein